MIFGTGFLVDNCPRPEFHDTENRHAPDFDFSNIKIGDRGIITFKEDCIQEEYAFSNFQVVVIDKSEYTITTKLDVSDLDSVNSITYHKTDIYDFEELPC